MSMQSGMFCNCKGNIFLLQVTEIKDSFKSSNVTNLGSIEVTTIDGFQV